MYLRKFALLGTAWLMLAANLAACTGAAPLPPTPTQTPQPTATLEPTVTETPVPTAVPPSPTAAASPTAPAASPTATRAPAAAGAAPEKYQLTGQNYADGSHVLPGIQLTIQWTIKNTGTIIWSKDYTLRHFAGVAAKQEVYNFPKVVQPGESVTLAVSFTAPAEYGDYQTWWKLTNANSQNFGDVDFTFTVGTAVKASATPAK